MNVDKALAKFSIFEKMLDGGDTGRGRVEHRNFLQLRFTHQSVGFRLLCSLHNKFFERCTTFLFHSHVNLRYG